MRVDLISTNHARLRKGLLKSGLRKLSKLSANAAVCLPGLANRIEYEDWFQPAVVCRSFIVQWLGEKRCRIGQEEIEGDALRALWGAQSVAVAFITLGLKVDAATAELSADGKALEAYLLGEIGLGALATLSMRTEAYVRAHASRVGMRIGSPIFPGDSGLELSTLRQFYDLINPGRAGIELTSSGMIKPVKSLCLLIGIGTDLQRWSRSLACQSCSSFQKCRRNCSNAIK